MKTTGNNRKKGSNIEDKARDNNLSRDPYKAEQTGEKIISRKIWKIWWVRVLSLLASIVVFCTVYALILPAVAVTEEDAENGSGFYLENGEETPAVTEMAYNGSGEDVQMVSMNVGPVNDGFSGDNSAVNETGSQDQDGEQRLKTAAAPFTVPGYSFMLLLCPSPFGFCLLQLPNVGVLRSTPVSSEEAAALFIVRRTVPVTDAGMLDPSPPRL